MTKLYLVAYYFTKPKNNRIRTEKPGWMKSPGAISYDEQVAITKNLSNKDLSNAKVILDMVGKKVVKNGWVSGRSFDELFLYYYGNYPQYTKTVMEKLDPEYLQRFMPESPASQPVQVIDTSTSISSINS